jgi:hypothetical protein
MLMMINTRAKTKFRFLKWGLGLIAVGFIEILFLMMGGLNPHSPTTFGVILLITAFPVIVVGILLSIIAGIRAIFKGY